MGAKNWVLEGDYKHKAVVMQGGKAVLNVGLLKNLKLDSSTIEQIEVVDEDSQKSMGSAVARGAVGSLLLTDCCSWSIPSFSGAMSAGVFRIATNFVKASLMYLQATRRTAPTIIKSANTQPSTPFFR